MKKFRFRLERILQLKSHAEKEKQKNYGLAVSKVVDQQTALAGIDDSRRSLQDTQRQRLSGALDTSMMSVFSRYYLLLKKKEIGGRELLKAYEKEQEKKRIELVEATREKKTYEKLKERKFEAYNKETELSIQKEQDEMASQMLQYKRSSRELSGASG